MFCFLIIFSVNSYILELYANMLTRLHPYLTDELKRIKPKHNFAQIHFVFVKDNLITIILDDKTKKILLSE